MVLTLETPVNTRGVLSIQVLGRFDVRLDGRTVELSSRKARALLGYLVLNESSEESRERLVGLLWSASDTERARGSLRQCLREIRTAISHTDFDGFETDKLAISLNRSRLDVDLWTVLDQARHGQAPELLLDGPGLLEDMLHELDSVDPEFSSWLTAKRKTLQERLLRQLEAHLRRDVQEEQDSLRMARVILNLDPSHEEACRSIMRTLSARGDATGAQRAYKQLWDVLDQEYGSEPDQKTQDLIAEIKNSTPLSGATTAPLLLRGDVGGPAGNGIHHAKPGPMGVAAAYPVPSRGPGGASRGAEDVKIVLSIAPFALTGPDGAPTHILPGFRRELIASLVRFREWVVRETAGGTGPRHSNADEYLLEAHGSHVDGSIRLSLTLMDTATSRFPWSGILDLKLENLNQTQRVVIQRIAAALNVHVSAGRLAQIAPRPDENLRAFDLWLHGQANMMTFDPIRWQQADETFRSIIERHPSFAPAYSSLAQMQNGIHFAYPGVMRTLDRTQEALTYAQTAVRLDPSDSRAQLCLGWSMAMAGRYEPAGVHHNLAIELNENDPWTLMSSGMSYAFRGEYEKGAELGDRSMALSLTPTPVHWCYRSIIHFFNKDFVGCIESAGMAEGEPSLAVVNLWKACALEKLGHTSEARQAADRFFSGTAARWFGPEPATTANMTRWFLHAFPIAKQKDWLFLRDGCAAAGAPVENLAFNGL